MPQIETYFEIAHERHASDVHLAAGQPPTFRVHGELTRLDELPDPLDHEVLRKILLEIAPAEKMRVFDETGDVDFGYEIARFGRFRANYFNQKNGCGAVFRHIPSKVPTVEDLNLPPLLRKAAMFKSGLVLVTGPTGSGKSTTLAAMVDQANRARKDHIITIEDPIEFVHTSQGCLVNHREIGSHTRSFATALRAALREDPDILMVGEMRDLETIRLAIEAAATGHLVFGTLHTVSAPKTVDRIIEVFPADEQAQVRSTLASGLKLTVAQRLLKRVDKPGRVAALEILLATAAVSNLVREGKTHQIASAIQTGKRSGMQSMDDALLELLKQKAITREDAYEQATEKHRFVPQGQPQSVDELATQ